MSLYKWQGKEVEVKFGFSIIKPNIEKILYWTNYHVRDKESVELPSIKVITNAKRNHSLENAFVIYNGFGIGENKLLCGGWPNDSHHSLPSHSFIETGIENKPTFNYIDYLEEVKLREIWFELKYGGTKEWKRHQALVEIIKTGHRKRFN